MPSVPIRVGYFQRYMEGEHLYFARAYDYDLTASGYTPEEAIGRLRRALESITRTVEDGVLEVLLDDDDVAPEQDGVRFQMATELASATLSASAPLGVLRAQAMTFYATMTEEGLHDAWSRLQEYSILLPVATAPTNGMTRYDLVGLDD